MLTLNILVLTKKTFISVILLFHNLFFSYRYYRHDYTESTWLKFKIWLKFRQFKLLHGLIWSFDSHTSVNRAHDQDWLLLNTEKEEEAIKENHNRFLILRTKATLKALSPSKGCVSVCLMLWTVGLPILLRSWSHQMGRIWASGSLWRPHEDFMDKLGYVGYIHVRCEKEALYFI